MSRVCETHCDRCGVRIDSTDDNRRVTFWGGQAPFDDLCAPCLLGAFDLLRDYVSKDDWDPAASAARLAFGRALDSIQAAIDELRAPEVGR